MIINKLSSPSVGVLEVEEIEGMDVDEGEKDGLEEEGKMDGLEEERKKDGLEEEDEGDGLEKEGEGDRDVENEGEGEGDRDEKGGLETGDTNEEMAPIEDDKIKGVLVVAITTVGKEEENKEVLKEKAVVDSIGDEDIVIREDTTEVVNINDDEKLSIEDISLLLGTGVVTVVVTIGISIELFDTVINDEVLKPFLMDKKKTSYKHHDNC